LVPALSGSRFAFVKEHLMKTDSNLDWNAAWAVPGVSRVISELKIDGGSAARAAGATA